MMSQRFMLAAFLLAWGIPGSRAADPPKPVKVFILAGQSNMEGQAVADLYGDKHHFGPELQFGHVLGDHFQNQVLLIKTAWGGKSLYKDFRPPSSGGEVGPYYTRMLADIRKALENLKTELPGYNDRGYELA